MLPGPIRRLVSWTVRLPGPSFQFVAALSAAMLACNAPAPPESKTGPSSSAASAIDAMPRASAPAPRMPTLADVRRGFKTHLLREVREGSAVPTPPESALRLVRYSSPVGDLAAYVSPPPAGATRGPAIIWLVGGFSNSIDGTAWLPAPPEDDQSARAFREAGIVLMLPSLRGGNRNPGSIEAFGGEVDDVLAAADYLAKLDYVDPSRIYLGGHSTGGTLALLVDESTDRFRAVFAFGPFGEACRYRDPLPFDVRDKQECLVRAPMEFLADIHSPTFIIEGAKPPANTEWLRLIGHAAARMPPIRALLVPGADHFSVLAPSSALLAAKIVADGGAQSAITLTEAELAGAVAAALRR